MRLRILAIAAAATLVWAAGAQAASWRQVTASGGASIDQVGKLRTADGVLHVVWHRTTGPNTGDLLHTTIAPDGRVGATAPIQTGWTGFQDAAVTTDPASGGIRAFWGAIRSTDSADPNNDLNTAVSTDGGASWALTPGSIVPLGAQAYGSDMSATTLGDGTQLQAWAGTLGTWVHAGLSPATPNTDYQAGFGNYGNYPAIASTGTGAVMAWFSSAASRTGILAQPVNAAGQPAGAVAQMPGTQVMVGGGTVARTPLAVRAGGGAYVSYAVGYPSADRIRLWRVGGPSARLMARASGSPATEVATDSGGRVWVVWSDGVFGSKTIRAVRSNKAATRFGAIVDVEPVKGAHSVYSLDASATAGALDILSLFGLGTESGGATYVDRVFPGLTLRSSVSSLGRQTRSVTFTVTDAGDPVEGATVRASGRSAKTDDDGKATLRLRNSATAKATKKDYTAATKRIR